MENIEHRQLTRKLRRRYFEYYNILYSNHLINLVILCSLSKSTKDKWNLNTRDLVILISASMLNHTTRFSSFSSSQLKLAFNEYFYSQEIHQSIKKLIKEGMVYRVKRNNYKITEMGRTVLRSYTQQFNKEFYKLKEHIRYKD